MKPKFHLAKTILAPLEALRSEGVSVAQALAGTGLSLSILNRPEQHVSLSQELAFLRNLRKATGDPAIGLRVGECYPLSLFGIYGYALMSSANMRDAMKLAYQFVELSFAFYEHSPLIDGDSMFMKMDSEAYSDADKPMLSEREMMATLMILRGLNVSGFSLRAAHLQHSALEKISVYEKAFACPVNFNAPFNALEIDVALLDKALLQCDSDTAAMCIERCEKIRSRINEQSNIVDTVREIMLFRPGYFPDIENVAQQLNLSSRTLRRKLAEKNMGFQKLLDSLRFEFAQEYLTTSNISIEKISELLDYSDPSHFCYAFKRWANCSPSQYRVSTVRPTLNSEGLSPVQRL